MPRETVKTIDDIERKAEVDEFITRRKAEKAAPKKESTNRLVVSREPEGLYVISWSGAGQLPEMLRGKFTSITKVNTLIDRYYTEKGVPRPADVLTDA